MHRLSLTWLMTASCITAHNASHLPTSIESDTLHLVHVTPSDMGSYLCIAKNRVGVAEANIVMQGCADSVLDSLHFLTPFRLFPIDLDSTQTQKSKPLSPKAELLLFLRRRFQQG